MSLLLYYFTATKAGGANGEINSDILLYYISTVLLYYFTHLLLYYFTTSKAGGANGEINSASRRVSLLRCSVSSVTGSKQ